MTTISFLSKETKTMLLSETAKITMFDKYIMRGGLETLQSFEDTCMEVLDMIGLIVSEDDFNDIVRGTIEMTIKGRPDIKLSH